MFHKEWDLLVSIDADLLVLRNMDHLFDTYQFSSSSASDTTTTTTTNSNNGQLFGMTSTSTSTMVDSRLRIIMEAVEPEPLYAVPDQV